MIYNETEIIKDIQKLPYAELIVNSEISYALDKFTNSIIFTTKNGTKIFIRGFNPENDLNVLADGSFEDVTYVTLSDGEWEDVETCSEYIEDYFLFAAIRFYFRNTHNISTCFSDDGFF